MRLSAWILGLVVIGLAVGCGGGDNGSSIDSGTDTDSDSDTDTDSDTDSDGDADGGMDGGTDAGTDVDAGSDAGTVIDCDPAWGWYDEATGLCWQNPPLDETTLFDWESAATYCDGLSLGGFDDWQLPMIQELISLLRGCVNGVSTGDLGTSECGVTDPDCLGEECWDAACGYCDSMAGPDDDPNGCYWDPALAGDCDWYWSSSSCTSYVSFAWLVDFTNGTTFAADKSITSFTRCIRGGP